MKPTSSVFLTGYGPENHTNDPDQCEGGTCADGLCLASRNNCLTGAYQGDEHYTADEWRHMGENYPVAHDTSKVLGDWTRPIAVTNWPGVPARVGR